jgi:4-hydroxyphenylpyruvate dioxygenase
MITQENPVGLKSIDHLEFVTPQMQSETATCFNNLGFERVLSSKNNDQVLYQQGQIRFLLRVPSANQTHPYNYLKNHHDGVSKISFRVDSLEKSLDAALKRGAVLKKDVEITEGPEGLIKTACVQGFGDVLNEFVERPDSIFRYGLDKIQNDDTYRPLTIRCSRIDHLTNNVPKGQMEHWVEFYKKIYGFRETRYFDIKGMKTGLFSKVVQSHDNNIIIPINEPEVENGKSQIQEFLDRHNGPGVQHIALMTPNILSTVKDLKDRGIKFLDVPDTYYEDIPNRPFEVQENIEDLKKLRLLCDGDEKGYLLQVFSDTYIGPLFFEYIQRKNHWGFGEGNFKALFDSIERDQVRRGYIK